MLPTFNTSHGGEDPEGNAESSRGLTRSLSSLSSISSLSSLSLSLGTRVSDGIHTKPFQSLTGPTASGALTCPKSSVPKHVHVQTKSWSCFWCPRQDAGQHSDIIGYSYKLWNDGSCELVMTEGLERPVSSERLAEACNLIDTTMDSQLQKFVDMTDELGFAMEFIRLLLWAFANFRVFDQGRKPKPRTLLKTIHVPFHPLDLELFEIRSAAQRAVTGICSSPKQKKRRVSCVSKAADGKDGPFQADPTPSEATTQATEDSSSDMSQSF